MRVYGLIYAGGKTMARTLAIGLTESGTEMSVNEDTFSFDQHVYPDMITGGEEKSTGSSDYTQLFVVTQGVGGSGAGDLAGRIFQRASRDMLQHISDYKIPELDFKHYADDLLTLAHAHLRGRMARRGKAYGVSFALLLIDANTAYVMNVGETGLLLYRNGRLLQISKPSTDKSVQEDVFHPYEATHRADGELPRDVLRADIVPTPNTLKRFTLEAGDIILLTSSGFFDNFDVLDLAHDLEAPDAFAATIRQAQIDSGIRDRRNNRTILAVKVRDLSLEAPQLSARGRGVKPVAEPQRSEAREYASPQPDDQVSNSRLKTDPDSKAPRSAESRKKKPLKTFLLSLLAGFLVGLAIIMVIWYIVIH